MHWILALVYKCASIRALVKFSEAKRRYPDSIFRCGHQGAKRLTENFATYEATMSL